MTVITYPMINKLKSDDLYEDLSREHEWQLPVLTDATVMMVDDEPTTLEVIQTFLEESGYQSFIATSQSTHAVEMILQERPDVVLLDLIMPEVSGFDILTRIRADIRLRYTPVIVLTSAVDANTKLKALELGATDFLAKPVDPSELVLRLRNTLAFKAYQDRLAYYDTLTGLPNRRMFLARLDWALEHAKRHKQLCALLYIDLDRFKQINDSLGYRVGDSLLRAVAQKLEHCVRDSDTVARLVGKQSLCTLSHLGGDEFTVLLFDMNQVEHAALVARRILRTMAEAFHVDNHELFLTPSIGIAVFPNDGEEIDTLLKNSDMAMSHAKQRGRNTFAFYSKEINARSSERLTLENQLRKALDREELTLHFQPKIDIASGQVCGAEALLRWQHPQLGMVPPAQFIPLAEEAGLINSIGEWALHAACAASKAWERARLGPLPIAVNVSSLQFQQRGFLQVIRRALESSGIEPQYLMLELTESTFMENVRDNLKTLHTIKEMGLKLSIDDFGTGYSSLSYLKRFPLDELKVDRSFVADIPADADSVAIVSAIIAMAHSLGLHVVAEGVEAEQQLTFLKEKACNTYQGYLYSKPVTDQEFRTLIRRSLGP
jgi:diguanylate cyclase (GGDEF)-like protein